MKKVTIVIIAMCSLLFSSSYSLAQLIDSTTVSENFNDNELGWTLSTNNGLNSTIDTGIYSVDFFNPNSFNQLINFPSKLKNCLNFDKGELSFECRFHINETSDYSGFGLVFDQTKKTARNKNGNYNVLYFGQENGQLFSSIIPRIDNFKQPTIQGGNIPFSDGKFNRIRITKDNITYRVYINDHFVLSFIHIKEITITKTYITTGQYEFRNLNVTKTILVIDSSLFNNKPKGKKLPETYILLVGVKNYADYKKDLNSPINDITKMQAFWRTDRGGKVPHDNIVYLPQDKGIVRKNDIIKNLTRIAARGDYEDVVIFYFSGHGSPGSISAYDGDINFNDINIIMSHCRAKHQLFIIDACFSGFIANKVVISNKGKDNLTSDQLQLIYKVQTLTTGKNINYLLSCDWDERSLDGKPNSNSLFTEAMLNILNKKTKLSSPYILTLQKLYDQLKTYFTIYNKQFEKASKPNVYSLVKSTMNPKLFSVMNNANDLPIALMTNNIK